MVLYPDNPKRIQRVQDLANDIAEYQDEIKSQNDEQKQSDQRAYDTLAEIAKMKGYTTPEEYIQAALDALPAKERQKFIKLREQIAKTGKNGDTILFVTSAMATIGMVGGAVLGEKGVEVLTSIGSWVSGLRASATSVELGLAGALEEANQLAEVGEEAFKGVETVEIGDAAPKAGTIAAEGVEEASTLVKIGRFASKGLVVLAILAAIGTLISEGIEGKKQMEKCQGYIIELCAKRFMIYKMKGHVETAFSFMSKIYGLLEYEKMVREDEDFSEEKREAKIQKKIKEVADGFAKLPVPVDETVYGKLGLKDEAANSWTNEDPKLREMKQYLEDLKVGKIKPDT